MDENPYKSPEEESDNEEDRFIVEYDVDRFIAFCVAFGLFMAYLAFIIFGVWRVGR